MRSTTQRTVTQRARESMARGPLQDLGGRLSWRPIGEWGFDHSLQ